MSDQATFEAWLRQLDDRDPQVREAAKSALQAAGEATIPALIRAFEDESVEGREQALGARQLLVELGQAGVPALLAALANDNPKRRERALAALKLIHPNLMPVLLAQLRSGPPLLRAGIAEGLGQMGSEANVIPVLITTLDDVDFHVRQGATNALIRLGSPHAELMKALKSKSVQVRSGAVYALAHSKQPEVVASLVATLIDDKSPAVRQTALGAVYHLNPQKLPALSPKESRRLREALTDFCGNPDEAVRIQSLHLLLKLRDLQTLPTLIHALIDTIKVSKVAEDGLRAWKDEQVTTALLAALSTAHEVETMRILYALGGERLRNPKLQAQILAIFGEDDELVWWFIAKVIRDTRPPLLAFNSPTAEPTSDTAAHFTAYYAREVQKQVRYGLYVYAHHRGSAHAVYQDAQKFAAELGGQVPNPRTVVNELRQLETGTPVTITPECEGVTFNPPSLTKKFDDKWTRFDFDMKVTGEVGDILVGRIAISLGPIEIANLKLAFEVVEALADAPAEAPAALQTTSQTADEATPSDNPLAQAKLECATQRTYQKIFVSYSREDKTVVEIYRQAQLALGNEVFVDTYSIRTGENWQAALAKAIDEAEVFQLFWSSHAAASPNVRHEWDYALQHRCSENRCVEFIRPVFWQNPLATPPAELNHLNFKFVALQPTPAT